MVTIRWTLRVTLSDASQKRRNKSNGRMARGGHGVSKISLGPAMLYPFMPCGRPPLKWTYGHFRSGCPCRAGGLRPSSTLLDTPYCTPLNKRENGDGGAPRWPPVPPGGTMVHALWGGGAAGWDKIKNANFLARCKVEVLSGIEPGVSYLLCRRLDH
jgi:hypothetical protein